MSIRIAGRNGFARAPMEKIYKAELTATGRFDITGIPLSYTHLWMFASLRTDVAAEVDTIDIHLNGDTTAANYRRVTLTGGTILSDNVVDDAELLSSPADSSPANYFSAIKMVVPFYNDDTFNKQILVEQIRRENATTMQGLLNSYMWENTAAINQITIQPDGFATDEFVVGSRLMIYGIY